MVGTITLHKAPAGALNGQSPKILVIGDSTTEFGMITALNTALTAQGATPTFMGTYAAATNPKPTSGLFSAEGRGSFSFRTYVGRDGIAATTNVTPGNGASHYSNPFLRQCVDADLSAHPERCFNYTAGQFRNLSYAEETSAGTAHSATASYYIFDFGYYVTTWLAGVMPDQIIIALDDNDILWGGGAGGAGSHTYTVTEAISFAVASLDIMVRSIREASSSVKIGISPLAARGNDVSYVAKWVSTYVPLIEAQMTEISALRAAFDTNIHGIGTWAHTNRDFPFPHTSSVVLSAANDCLVQNVSDKIHWSTDGTQLVGKDMVANVWAGFIACMVSGA